MATMTLKNKKFGQVEVLFDDEDIEIISKFNWYITSQGYCARTENFIKNGKKTGKTILLHRFILNIVDKKVIVDHINSNKLDNRKVNLRLTDNSGNTKNRNKFKGNLTSKFKGVHYQNKNRPSKWVVQINIDGKQKYIGAFKTELDAAKAYNKAALINHGEFANLNKIEE